ncbi:enoyl-CoA hydratase-related protein [Dactylosporangium sp. NPDC000555]|uniref:enoyl-CoA hydratase/isomerase family protein n=1 Tax=Dactylosporangium sp. NPDC000555 TaxID=3154260 RepID=UPI003332ED07
MSDSAVAIVSIDNPSARNSLDDRARRALLADLASAQSDPDVRVIVLHGEGGHFCAGGELRSMPTEPHLARARMGEMHTILRLVVEGPKPVLAAVEGSAYGSGMALASACDVVVAGQSAIFGCTFGRVGLAPDTGLAWTLARRLGHVPARRVLLGGMVLKRDRAAELGLVDVSVPDGEALSSASAEARRMAAAAPLATAGVRALVAGASTGLTEFLDLELSVQTNLLASDDFREGRTAFFDRRPPVFSGR